MWRGIETGDEEPTSGAWTRDLRTPYREVSAKRATDPATILCLH